MLSKNVVGTESHGTDAGRDICAKIDGTLSKHCKLIVPEDDASGIIEEFRRIKQNILIGVSASDNDAKPQVIMVTSPAPGDGKSFFSLNLALTVARDPDSIAIFIDADVKPNNSSSMLGLGSSRGLSDLLANSNLSMLDVINGTSSDRLYVIPSGRQSRYMPEFLSSRRMGDILDQVRSVFSDCVIVIDTPPVLAHGEARALAVHADQAVIVVASYRTKSWQISDALDTLNPLIGTLLVLNRAPTEIGRKARRSRGYKL